MNNSGYKFILKTAINKRDNRAQKQIEKVVFNDTYYENRSYVEIKSKFTNKYGGGFKRTGYSNFETLKHILTCPNYTFKERLNILRGSSYSYQSLAPFMHTTDLVELVPTLNLSVFILHVLYDYQTTHPQANRFYESVEAPYKKMYTFIHSAHTPFIEEEECFNTIIKDEVLKNIKKGNH